MTDSTQAPPPRKRGPQPPSVRETAFVCPHCGTHTTQYWYNVFVGRLEQGKTPFIVREDIEEYIRQDTDLSKDQKERMIEHYLPYLRREVLFEESEAAPYNPNQARNLALSKCYECNDIAVWLHTRLIWPPERTGPAPNNDLPALVKDDYEEARAVLGLSPRGAAALLRLCVEKLCIHLNAAGKTIDQRIADLVSKGLDPRVQMSLDAVRVIGNEAVHPGQMDLKDDHVTAETLFRLVNLIADKMISEPAHVKAVYDTLPQAKREGIKQRDKRPS